ncbi:Major pollen allergen aln g [Thalictrum thalictroides]|uniref:Major pollen allergen aln g n=1 Tax=Thalictrum thalictroides TaxID=46969 RepID=A0A7J6VWY6_THATH|nr:Major pollen allergen aln g [Thalictrum thalictroides]
MGVTGFSAEIVTSVPADKMFKACVFDMHILAPKLMPEVVKSASFIGDGGVGSFNEYHFTDVISYDHVKERIEALDKNNFVCKYSLAEGGNLGTKLKSSSYQVKFTPSGNGSVAKVDVHMETIEGVEYSAEEINKEKEGLVATYKAVESHLLANP